MRKRNGSTGQPVSQPPQPAIHNRLAVRGQRAYAAVVEANLPDRVKYAVRMASSRYLARGSS